MKLQTILVLFTSLFWLTVACKPANDETNYGTLQLVKVRANNITLNVSEKTVNIPVNSTIKIEFSSAIDTISAKNSILVCDSTNVAVNLLFSFAEGNTVINVTPTLPLAYKANYSLQINNLLLGVNKETFTEASFLFETENGLLKIEQIELNGNDFSDGKIFQNVPLTDNIIEISFNFKLNAANYKSYFSIPGFNEMEYSLSENQQTVTAVSTQAFSSLKKYYFTISSALKSYEGYGFDGFTNYFYTAIDSTPKFPIISDNELLTLVQKQTFKYFWDYAHPVSGLTRERLGSGDVVASGGSGFGLMAILVGIERGFITRQEAYERLNKIVTFLNNPQTEKFHGAFPHWLNGSSGEAIAFSTKDNGADLVETAYLMQGLLTVREYFKEGSTEEKEMCNSITTLWESVEWDWFRRGEQNVLYWHWSPNYGWDMNMQINGWSECLIVYVLAASSPTHSIPQDVYTNGWARNGAFPMKNGKSFYGITLPLSWDYGGPLFWAHYSFLGLDPRKLEDQYANYWEQNVAHSLINFEYCKDNPKNYLCYSADCWGLTASDIPDGYAASEPSKDLGVIAPTAAISSLAYSPQESMDAIRFFYYVLGDKLWGEYGFYDAFNADKKWWAGSYLAIDQGPEICMIENHRSALLWNLFMQNTEIQSGLTKLGFSYE